MRVCGNWKFALTPFLVALLCGCQSTDQQVNYGLNHYRMGLYNQAIPPLLSAASALEKTSPPDPRLPQVLGALGEMAWADRLYDRAEGYYRKALTAADALATPDDNAQRNALVNLGYFYLQRERPAEALPLLERAAKISGSNPRFRRTLHAIDLDNIGLAHSSLKRDAEGRAYGLRALKVLDDAKGTDQEAVRTRGVVLYNLAYGYAEEQRYAEAEANYRRALEILAPSAGPQAGENWRVRTVLKNYADMLRKLGREQEAAALDRRREGLKGP